MKENKYQPKKEVVNGQKYIVLYQTNHLKFISHLGDSYCMFEDVFKKKIKVNTPQEFINLITQLPDTISKYIQIEVEMSIYHIPENLFISTNGTKYEITKVLNSSFIKNRMSGNLESIVNDYQNKQLSFNQDKITNQRSMEIMFT